MIKLIYPKFWQSKNIWSYALWPLSLIYRLLSYLRKLFSKKIFLPAKVICVGNISVGGTGKTQVVIWLAKIFAKREINFVIIAKGYRGKFEQPVIVNSMHIAQEVGDEAVLLRRYGTTIIAKKIVHAVELLEKLKPEVIIVDDGMQNPNFHKDITLTMIDSYRGFGNEFLLPAGPLRQSVSSGLAQTDIIIATGNNSKNLIIDSIQLDKLTSKPIFYAKLISNLKLDKSKNYLAFSGIGNPERFFITLADYGLNLIDTIAFPDHHVYSTKDLNFLKNKASSQEAILITTAKDYVKMSSEKLEIVKFDVELEFSNADKLIDLIYEKIF